MSRELHNVPGIISVVLVYGIILTEYYIFVFHFLPAYQQVYEGWASVIGVEFTILYFILHIAYWQAQHVSPGFTPKDLAKHYHETTLSEIKERTKRHAELHNKKRKNKLMKRYELPEEDEEELLYIFEANYDIIQSIQLISYCFKCQNLKLPRTHHCKECNKCILRMDHHCPWVNNCIGLKNHRFFCQFLIYALSCMLQCTYFVVADNWLHGGAVSSVMTGNDRFLCYICAATCFALNVAMGTLLAFHIYHIANNVTTVEFHIEEMKTDNPFKKPKIIDNFKELFGEQLKYWIWPIREQQRNELPRQDLFEV